MLTSLGDLFTTKRVIVTVGCGGVGKTTVAAALALAAARRGRRVLCLTIDPAKRLATSLGLREMRARPRRSTPRCGAPRGRARSRR
jgi:anion-transporting  ArsA/GET3 family ATPase